MFATMTGVAKVEVAAAGAAGILVTILVLLVASPSFPYFLQQFRFLFSWNPSLPKTKKRWKNSLLGNHKLKSTLVFTKMCRIIPNTFMSNFSKMCDHWKAQKKTWRSKFAFLRNLLFTKTLKARKPLLRERSNYHQRLPNGFLHVYLSKNLKKRKVSQQETRGFLHKVYIFMVKLNQLRLSTSFYALLFKWELVTMVPYV